MCVKIWRGYKHVTLLWQSSAANGKKTIRFSARLKSFEKRLIVTSPLSVRPSLSMYQLDCHWKDSHEILCLKYLRNYMEKFQFCIKLATNTRHCTRVGTLIVATIYLQLIQNRYMFRIFTVPQCSHQHCVQPVASDVEVVGYL